MKRGKRGSDTQQFKLQGEKWKRPSVVKERRGERDQQRNCASRGSSGWRWMRPGLATPSLRLSAEDQPNRRFQISPATLIIPDWPPSPKMPLPRSRLRAASATPSEDSASVVSSAVEPPSHVGPGWRGAASKPVVAATEDSDSDLSSLSSVHDDSDSESGSDSDSNSDSDSSEEDEEQSNHDDGSDSQRPQKARQPNRKRHAPEDSPDKSSKRRKQDGGLFGLGCACCWASSQRSGTLSQSIPSSRLSSTRTV